MSPYGRLLRYIGVAPVGSVIDVPNPVLGLGFYACHLFYPALSAVNFPFLPQLGLAASAAVCGLTCWLGYCLFITLQDFCVVCVSTYVCNFLLLPTMLEVMRRD